MGYLYFSLPDWSTYFHSPGDKNPTSSSRNDMLLPCIAPLMDEIKPLGSSSGSCDEIFGMCRTTRFCAPAGLLVMVDTRGKIDEVGTSPPALITKMNTRGHE